jgi:hypothetical protein
MFRPVTRILSPGQHGDCPRFIPLMEAIRIGWRGKGRTSPQPRQSGRPPAGLRPRTLQGKEHGRTLLQQAQAVPRRRHPLRQARTDLPGHRRRRLDPDLAPGPRSMIREIGSQSPAPSRRPRWRRSPHLPRSPSGTTSKPGNCRYVPPPVAAMRTFCGGSVSLTYFMADSMSLRVSGRAWIPAQLAGVPGCRGAGRAVRGRQTRLRGRRHRRRPASPG